MHTGCSQFLETTMQSATEHEREMERLMVEDPRNEVANAFDTHPSTTPRLYHHLKQPRMPLGDIHFLRINSSAKMHIKRFGD